MDQYFGTYQTFNTVSKNDGAALIGADNLIGDLYRIDIEMDSNSHKAWLVNRFDKRVGFFDAKFSRELSIWKARGMKMTAILSFVAYSDAPDPGRYWGEMAVICYNPSNDEAFSTFVEGVRKKMGEGTRLNVNLKDNEVKKVLSSKGTWLPDQNVPMPKLSKGNAIMKSRLSVSEKVIEQGRKGNKGCYAASWAFLIALVVLILLGLKSCGVF
ncbi:hypothetical protein [Adlercreutzia sp. ZJ242]|uniref:hypothetical protein n=1 Tax=Adlercreutzia sp. ZJ242 TaxID=2709409 RepID=UPI0013EA28CB|nr:hypothetical protein [Adlercreutzia sp. ZJ242]